MSLTQISTAGVKDDAVTAGKIPANAVGTSEIAGDAVTSTELAANAVTTVKINNDAVNNSKLAANAVSTVKIADEAVTLAKLPHGTSSNDGKFLRANNGADPTFETVSIPAGTTINNNADNKIITGSGTANTLEAESLAQIASDGDLWIGHAPTTHYDNRKAFFHQPTADETCYISITGPQGAGIVFGDSPGQNTGNYESIIWHRNSDDRLMITTDNGNKGLYLENGGDIEVIDGNVKFASGHGIDFSATANASSSESTTSMSNELFDDYEVGTWQPTWKPNSGSIGHLSRHGDYVKIGRTVHCMFAISSNGSTNPSGELQLSGLPFSATIPNANGTRGGGGVLFPGYHMASGVTKCVANGTTLFLLLSDSSRLQTNSSGIGYGYNAAQLSGMFSYITAS